MMGDGQALNPIQAPPLPNHAFVFEAMTNACEPRTKHQVQGTVRANNIPSTTPLAVLQRDVVVRRAEAIRNQSTPPVPPLAADST